MKITADFLRIADADTHYVERRKANFYRENRVKTRNEGSSYVASYQSLAIPSYACGI